MLQMRKVISTTSAPVNAVLSRAKRSLLARLESAIATTGAEPTSHPILYCREFDGGRTFYTGGGHTKESYGESAFRAHLLGGIVLAAGLADEYAPPE